MTVSSLQRVGALPDASDRFANLPSSVHIVARPFVAMTSLRLDPASAAAADVGGHLGFPLPTTPSSWVETYHLRVIWLGPDEWLVTSSIQAPATLQSGLQAVVNGRGAVVDVSGQRTTLGLSGANARDVLSGGCAIDLHPAVFGRGSAVQTLLGRAGIILLALDDTGSGYDVLVRSSFAHYLATWLVDAAVEHGDA